MSFKKILLKSFVFSAFSSIIVRILTFGTTIVLSRILSSYEFGLIGQAILIINIFNIFCDFGFSEALIYQKEDLKKIINTTFLIVLPLSFTLSLIAFFLSPLTASFFNNQGLVNIYRLLAWTIFLNAVTMVLSSVLTKKMEFGKLVYPEIFSALAYAIIGIWMAKNGYGVWSLVLASFAAPLVKLIFLYFLYPWKLELIFDKKLAKNMFSYGKEVVLITLIVYFAFQGDNLFCGKFLDARVLGFYALAYNVANLPVISITHLVILKVAFPLLSSLQDNPEKLRKSFLKMFLLSCFLLLPIATGILVLGKSLVLVVFGKKWIAMLGAMQILAIFGFLRSTNGLFGTLLNSIGKPYIQKNTLLVHVIVMGVLIFPLGLKFGILGVALTVLIAQLASVLVVAFITQNIVKFSWLKFMEILFFSAAISAFMGICLYIMTKYIFVAANVKNFLILISLGTLIYCAVFFILKREWFEDVKQIFELFLPPKEMTAQTKE